MARRASRTQAVRNNVVGTGIKDLVKAMPGMASSGAFRDPKLDSALTLSAAA